MDFIENYILKEYIITGQPRREERWQYPTSALREIIINAVVHRDYREGVHSQFKVFPEKIIFWNIGKLPADLSLEDMRKGTERSRPRNKLIAEIFRDCGLIERYGSGVKKVIDQFKAYGLNEPSFQESAGGIEVVAHSEANKKVTAKVTNKVTVNQRKILKFIKKDKFITTKELSKFIGISDRKIKENISKLKTKGLLKRIGPAKGGHWEVMK